MELADVADPLLFVTGVTLSGTAPSSVTKSDPGEGPFHVPALSEQIWAGEEEKEEDTEQL